MHKQTIEQLAETAETAAGSLKAGFRKAEETIESGKQHLADAMDNGSDKILSGAAALEDKALNTAGKLSDGASYLRNTSGADFLVDCQAIASKYPLQAMAMAAFAGILLGRVLGKRHSG